MAKGGSILVKQNSITVGMHCYRRVLFFFSLAICAWAFDSEAQQQLAAQKLLTVWAGALPIILSAPHGGRQPIPGLSTRRGVGVAQFATGRDNNTDELAQRIAIKLEASLGAKPFLIVADFERKYLDPNRPPQGAYESIGAKVYFDAYHAALREACERAIRDWGRGLLLDIHGQSADGKTIYRGTNNGRTVSSLTRRFGMQAISGPKSIFGQLERLGYKVLPEGKDSHKEDRYAGGYIVQTYGSHRQTGMDAIQLEFGAALRARANLERTAADSAHAVAIFAQEYLPLIKASPPIEAPNQP